MTVVGNTFSEVPRAKHTCTDQEMWLCLLMSLAWHWGKLFMWVKRTIGRHHSRNFIPSSYFFLGQLNGYGRFQSRKDRGVSEPGFEYDVVFFFWLSWTSRHTTCQMGSVRSTCLWRGILESSIARVYSRVCTVLIPGLERGGGGGVFDWDDCGARSIADTCTRESFFLFLLRKDH